VDAPFAPQILADADYWARFLADEWIRDFPLAQPGTGWRSDFEKWLSGAAGDRTRTTRVMRKLRRTAPREFETLYRAMILGESFEQITTWLNERAIRNGIPLDGREVHYTVRDAVALFLSGVEFCRSGW
jgi:hypothetical protein